MLRKLHEICYQNSINQLNTYIFKSPNCQIIRIKSSPKISLSSDLDFVDSTKLLFLLFEEYSLTQ